jgi:hypothetical protein
LRYESQRAEQGAVAAETDQCVRLIDQLSRAHRLDAVGHSCHVPGIDDYPLAM